MGVQWRVGGRLSGETLGGSAEWREGRGKMGWGETLGRALRGILENRAGWGQDFG